jgi:coenzyme F420 biosynthesis associated uncharacterized protein
MGSQELVDWDSAAALAGRLGSPGPQASRQEIGELVDSLHDAARRAIEPVVAIAELAPADGRDLAVQGLSGVRVIDRARWAQASAQSMRAMTDGALRRPPGQSIPLRYDLASGLEVGATLAFMSTKILGQFDPYADPTNNLLLVAPNVLQVERDMNVKPEDFRLWVCLHEQTHALQFAAAPWLAGHMMGRTRELIEEMTAMPTFWQAAARLGTTAHAVYSAVRGTEGPTILDGLLNEKARAAFDDTSAIMALLEGHADVAMDAVGPSVVPSVRSIRKKFAKRRASPEGPDRILRRLLGMELKMAQYRDGAAFVRAVTKEVGTSGLNAIWTGPSTLPSVREIADPIAWVRRVHG